MSDVAKLAPRRRKTRRGRPKQRSIADRITSAPVSISTLTHASRPSVKQSGLDGQRVVNKEMIFPTVAGSTTFTVQYSLDINPGIPNSFPWLSQVAINYEFYKIHSLSYTWVPIAPTSTQGDVILSPNYDALDGIPTTELKAANTADSIEFSCWANATCRLDPKSCMGGMERKYVRLYNASGDLKTYDAGSLFVCTNNETGTGAIGKLWCNYDIEFFKPQADINIAAFRPNSTSLGEAVSTTMANGVYTILPLTATYDPMQVFNALTSGTFTPVQGIYAYTISTTCYDSNNENFYGTVALYQNGSLATGTNASKTQFAFAGSGNGVESSLSMSGIFYTNGSQTFGFYAQLNGAAGTLAMNNTNVLIWPA